MVLVRLAMRTSSQMSLLLRVLLAPRVFSRRLGHLHVVATLVISQVERLVLLALRGNSRTRLEMRHVPIVLLALIHQRRARQAA